MAHGDIKTRNLNETKSSSSSSCVSVHHFVRNETPRAEQYIVIVIFNNHFRVSFPPFRFLQFDARRRDRATGRVLVLSGGYVLVAVVAPEMAAVTDAIVGRP